MKRSAKLIWSHLKAMPEFLRGATIALWIGGALMVSAPFLPGWRDETGRAISRRELWADGTSPLVLASAVAMALVGVLLYRGDAWVRHALMLGIIAAALSGFFREEYRDIPLFLTAAVAGITIILGTRYLYFKKDVIAYFTRGSSGAARGSETQPGAQSRRDAGP